MGMGETNCKPWQASKRDIANKARSPLLGMMQSQWNMKSWVVASADEHESNSWAER